MKPRHLRWVRLPGLAEVPGAVDPKTTTCLTPPRPIIACTQEQPIFACLAAAYLASQSDWLVFSLLFTASWVVGTAGLEPATR